MRHTWIIALAAMLAAGSPLRAQQGTIVGRAVDETSDAPLAGTQISVLGTSLGGLADAEGRFIIRGVPAGEHRVRATLIGYSPRTQTVTVQAGGTANITFQLGESAIALGALVVSATGQQQAKREIGSSVGVIDVENVELAPIRSFSDLIKGRTAGATVLQSTGTTGTGSKIRIRGSNSISLSNAPLLVIDGMRVYSDESINPIGGFDTAPSALDDLNPENIESIEILKGPAASALYGTAAANGVIQVTTKRGRAGASQVRAWAEYSDLQVSVDFPDNVQSFDADGNVCTLLDQVTLDSSGDPLCGPVVQTRTANPLENKATTVFDGGSNATYGASMSGGSDVATYFVSGEYTDEESVYSSDNYMRRYNLRANLTGQLFEDLHLRASVGYVDWDAQYPQADNALFGALGMGLFGPTDSATVAATGGYTNPLDFHYDWQTFQSNSRLISSAGADWAPLPWLTVTGSAGLERISRSDETQIPRDNAFSPFGGVYTHGWIQNRGWDIYNIDTNLSGSAVYDISPSLVSTSTAGAQYLRSETVWIYAFGAGLTPGIDGSLAGATSDFSVGEGNVLNGTISAYAQQQFSWEDRIFVNGAVRGDKNTAFGTDIGWIWYPSVSGSWVISEESFFPDNDVLSDLRLRAAYGQAGLRPGATAALLSFAANVTSFGNADVPAITINQIGNPELKPERTSEFEVGFEAGFLGGKLGLETTYYRKHSTDALVNLPLPPSPGGSGFRFENLGAVRNSGFEVGLNAEALRTDNVTWNLALTGAFLSNELEDLGTDAQGQPLDPIVFAVDRQKHIEGYPLGGYWQEPILGYDDANGDGILAADEVMVGDSMVYLGSSFPLREMSLSTDITLFGLLRLSALFDYKGDYKLFNQTRDLRCTQNKNCQAAYSGTLEEQAAIVARSEYGTWAGFIEDADFVKFRELSATLRLPGSWARYFKADDLRITLAGRNLATWTSYSGLDPEVNSYGQTLFAGSGDFSSRDISTLPPNRMLSVRFDVAF